MKKILCSLLLLCVGVETVFAAEPVAGSGARRKKRSTTTPLSKDAQAQQVADARKAESELSRSKSPSAQRRASAGNGDDLALDGAAENALSQPLSLERSESVGLDGEKKARKKWDRTPPPTDGFAAIGVASTEGLVLDVRDGGERVSEGSAAFNALVVVHATGGTGVLKEELNIGLGSGDAKEQSGLLGGGEDGQGEEEVEDGADNGEGSGPEDLQSGGVARGFNFLKKKKKEPVIISVDPALVHEDVANEADKGAAAGRRISPDALALLDAQRQGAQEGDGRTSSALPVNSLLDGPALEKQSVAQHVDGSGPSSKLPRLPRARLESVDGDGGEGDGGEGDGGEGDGGEGDGEGRTDLLVDKKEKDDEGGSKEKEKKLIQAGSSSFSRVLTGCVTAGFGYVVTALVHDRGGLPGLGVLATGMSVPFVLKKTGIIAKELDATEKAAVYGLLAGAAIYTGAHSTKYVPALRLSELKLPTFSFSDVSQNVVARFTKNQ